MRSTKPRQTYSGASVPFPVDEPHRWLAADILNQAVSDWRRYKLVHERRMAQLDTRGSSHDLIPLVKDLGFASPRDELIEFFHGPVFTYLVDYFSDPAVVRQKLGIPDATIPRNKQPTR